MPLNKQTFQKFVFDNALFTADDVLLVGVSGGIDSMVLCHILLACGFQFQIAHVNYGLRGAESDDDESFIRAFASEHNILLHVEKLGADHLIHESVKGIQEMARDVRYRFFSDVKKEIAAHVVLTAHHQDDQAETILHQFLRGGMLAALRGMKTMHNGIARPLLSFSRKDIHEYASDHRIAWREDSSNASTKYTRNFLRHEVIPALEKVNPNITTTLSERAETFAEIEMLVEEVIKREIETHVEQQYDDLLLSVEWLKNYPYQKTLLWYFLSAHGFAPGQTDEVIALLNSQTGARVMGNTNTIWRDRDHLILGGNGIVNQATIEIDELPFHISSPVNIKGKLCSLSEVQFLRDRNAAYLDADMVQYPLSIRPWQEGDKLVPLGMTGHQKVSDLLIQHKVSLKDKSRVFVLESGGQIAWVIGFRISEHFKISSTTTQALGLFTM